MTPEEKNKQERINELNRRVSRLEEAAATTNLDLESGGRVSMAFDSVEEHLVSIDNRLSRMEQRMERNHNQMSAKLENMMQSLTKIRDLPEE